MCKHCLQNLKKNCSDLKQEKISQVTKFIQQITPKAGMHHKTGLMRYTGLRKGHMCKRVIYYKTRKGYLDNTVLNTIQY